MISTEPYGGTSGTDDVVEMHMQQALAFAQQLLEVADEIRARTLNRPICSPSSCIIDTMLRLRVKCSNRIR